MRRALLLVILAVWCGAAPAQVVISEFMAANRDILLDRDGYSTDWVELHNAGDRAVDLAGHFLTNAKKDPRRWQFPRASIPARGYLVVHLSGKDRRTPGRPLHTNFRIKRRGDDLTLFAPDGETVVSRVRFDRQYPDVSQGLPQRFTSTVLLAEDAEGRVLVPRNSVPYLPTEPGYDDSRWVVGRGGFGFDEKRIPTLRESIRTDVGKYLRGRNATVYYRLAFDVDDPSAFDLAVFRVRYETGFVAYLNGQEIARRRAPRKLGVDAEAEVGLEPRDPFRSEYFAIPAAKSVLRPGRNVLAIQGLIESANSLEHLMIAEIVGYESEAPEAGELVYLDEPTPGRPNGAGRVAMVEPPSVTPDGALFRDSIEVELATGVAGAVIRYTLDGSDPTESSPRYTAPIRVETTAEVRARAFQEGARPSLVVSSSCTKIGDDLAEFSSNLPIAVLTTFGRSIRPKTFIDAHGHVLAPATGARTDWSSPVDYSGRIGIKTRGSSTLDRPKKGYGCELRDHEGEERARSLLGMPADTHWVLYAPHNWDQAHMRNALCYDLARTLGLDSPRFRFLEVFVNPERRPVQRSDYVGLYLLVERISPGPHRVDIETLPLRAESDADLSGGYMLKIDRPGPGDMGFTSKGQRLQFVYPKERHVTDPQRAWLKRYFDAFGDAIQGEESTDPERGYAAFLEVDNWIDYHLFNEYTKNPDAYTLSTYLYKRRDGKLRMGPAWDYDRAMRTNDEDYWVGRASRPSGWTSDCYYSWWGLLFRDPEFRKRYRARGRRILENEFRIDRVCERIDAFADKMREAEERDRQRWPIIEAGGWDNEVLDLKEWIRARDRWFRDELLEMPKLRSSSPKFVMPFSVSIEHGNEEGVLYYTTDGADPRLSNGDVSPRAKVYEGPIEIARDTKIRARVKVDDKWSRLADRWYVRRVQKIAITEVMYNPRGGRNYEFIELHNYGDSPVDLSGVDVSGAVRFHFAMGTVKSLDPGERVVIVRDRVRFANRYDVTKIRVAGEYMGRFSNTAGELIVSGSVGEELCRVKYDDGWFPDTDGKGYSLEARRSDRKIEKRGEWRRSAESGGSPGR